MDEEKVVTDCCGRLLPKSQTVQGDVHLPDMCPACSWGWAGVNHGLIDPPEHDSHVTCTTGDCPGNDWTYSGDPADPAKV